ncbi:Enoyl-[acyl-carrier-protein] reductase [NADPH, B-specific] 2, mitochondrial [Dionaea muscipula]
MKAMLRAVVLGLVISTFLMISVSAAADNEYPRCNCDEDGFWSIENTLEYQRVADFLIAVAYFSIPIELIYFVSCSNIPFKWILFQFIAFIVLCGMTHLLTGWAYGPHAFHLAVAITIFKFLTALVSSATAITLLTLFPMLLKVKVREFMLKKKTSDLDREVGIIKRQREAGWHVRMLTREIRKSLDRHTILYTTLVELSKALDLQNCAVWMPNENRTEMLLIHESKGTRINHHGGSYMRSIPYSEPDVKSIKESDEVKILRPDSALATASISSSTGLFGEAPGAVAAIRMPMLRVSNFKGGTPELMKACYAILVLVLPCRYDRSWTSQQLEIIKVVADQVTVAISHAAILEESQLMREKLVQQNHALQQAKEDAMMASQARNSFLKVMSNGMRKPMHSIFGLLSMLKDGDFNPQQQLIVDTMVEASVVLSTLTNDVMGGDSAKENPSRIRSFRLHKLIREAGCLAKCLCVHKCFDFIIDVDTSLPDRVMGDERRVFQVILHMVGNLLDNNKTGGGGGGGGGGGTLTFRVFSQHEHGSQGTANDKRCALRRSNSSDGHVKVRFEVEIVSNDPFPLADDDSVGVGPSQCSDQSERRTSDVVQGDLSFSMCQKLVQLMRGNIWVVPNPRGFPQCMALVLQFQLQPSNGFLSSELSGDSSEQQPADNNSIFKGLHILLADDDDMNRAVTKKLLEKLGCRVTAVSSGHQCLTSAISPSGARPQIVILELQMRDLDGFEIAAGIRRMCSHSWPFIVASSSNADADLLERIKTTAIDGLIQKPVSLESIVEELRRIMLAANNGRILRQLSIISH